MPPPSRAMISSANRCATVRAMSSLAASLYCLPSTCGVGGVAACQTATQTPPAVHRSSRALQTPPSTHSLEPPTTGSSTISCGDPGIACGARLFDTISKMPALPRSLKSVASNTAFSAAVCGSLAHRLEVCRRDAESSDCSGWCQCAPSPAPLLRANSKIPGTR